MLKNTTAQVVAKGITAGGTLLVTILLARALGQEQYGAFTQAVTLVGFLSLLVDFGGNPFFLQEKEQRLSQFLLLRFMITCGCICIGSLVLLTPLRDALHLSTQATISMWILLIALVPQAIFYTTQVTMQKKGIYELATLSQGVGTTAMIGAASIAFMMGAPLPYYVSALVLGNIVTAIVSILSVGFPLQYEQLDVTWMKKFLIQVFPFTCMLLFNVIYFRIDVVQLSYFSSSTAVGIYGFAYRFFDFFIAIPLFLSNALYPTLLTRHTMGKPVFDLMHVTLFVGTSFILAIAGWVGAPLLALINQDFAASVMPFRILIVSLPIFFLSSYVQWLLITKKQQGALAVIYCVCGIGTILCNMIVIPQWSYIGAAVVTCVAEGVVLLFLLLRYATLKHT